MPKIDFEWVKTQLTKARVKKQAGDGAIKLLKVWDTMNFASPQHEKETIEVFSSLAQNHALPGTSDTGRWAPANVGYMLQVGDVVRVKANAFEGELGRIHNGRVGKIVAKRWGDIIVKHTDGLQPSRDDARYPSSVLEKKV